MENSKSKQFLSSVMDLIKEDAFQAKKEYLSSEDENARLFNDGVLMGYYHVISLLRQQAEVFGYQLSEINLDDIDPDKDLLG